MIEVLYFAGLREAPGCSRETVGLPDGVRTVGALRVHLAARGEPWQNLATAKNLRAAVTTPWSRRVQASSRATRSLSSRP